MRGLLTESGVELGCSSVSGSIYETAANVLYVGRFDQTMMSITESR